MTLNQQITTLADSTVPWLADQSDTSSIVISSRIRLARNLHGYPFPIAASTAQKREILKAVGEAVSVGAGMASWDPIEIQHLDEIDRQVLFERNLISNDHRKGDEGAGVVISRCEQSSIMVNEEDHLRIQMIRPGLALPQTWRDMNDFDDALSRQLTFAFNRKFGYLTCCPTNLGTGLRASLMVHLPGLVLADQIKPVVNALNKLGLAVRGLFGEGSECFGNLFQISNQSTLGQSENDILLKLERVMQRVLDHESNARYILLERNHNQVTDLIGRAFGILSHAHVVDTHEALSKLSIVRMGVDLGLITTVRGSDLNELIVKIQPGHLQKRFCEDLPLEERDVLRAKIIRDRLTTGD